MTKRIITLNKERAEKNLPLIVILTCDVCDESDFGTKDELTEAGWLQQNEYPAQDLVCPDCRD